MDNLLFLIKFEKYRELDTRKKCKSPMGIFEKIFFSQFSDDKKPIKVGKMDFLKYYFFNQIRKNREIDTRKNTSMGIFKNIIFSQFFDEKKCENAERHANEILR